MTKVRLIAALLLSVCYAADANSGPREAGDDWAAQYRAQESAVAPFSPAGGLVWSGNDCPPDRAVRVWGGRSGLLGYKCVTQSAN
jgi:hypothetical protein